MISSDLKGMFTLPWYLRNLQGTLWLAIQMELGISGPDHPLAVAGCSGPCLCLFVVHPHYLAGQAA